VSVRLELYNEPDALRLGAFALIAGDPLGEAITESWQDEPKFRGSCPTASPASLRCSRCHAGARQSHRLP
jgi:hypothetical protein